MLQRTVHYKSLAPLCCPVIGLPMFVYPVDHTSPFVSNEKVCMTSPVLSFDKETGEFCTLNSIYRPLDESALVSFKESLNC